MLPPLIAIAAALKSRAKRILLCCFLSSTILVGCGTTPLHKGRLPFSLLEIPPGGSHLGSEKAAFQAVESGSKLQAGDVVAFHMSHKDAWSYLRQGIIAKVPYEMFSFGHLALIVDDPAGSSDLRLLQLSLGQPVTAHDRIDYLNDLHWAHYRPTKPIDRARLREFVAIVGQRASDPETAYDVLATLGLRRAPVTPMTEDEIGSHYTCVTLVKAALHYAGHPTNSLRREGFLDVLTPKQLLESAVGPN